MLLRIVLLEVGEELGVGEVLQTRSIVCHDVGFSWEVESEVTVALLALVSAGVVAKVRSSAFTADCAFRGSGDCRSVVASVQESSISDVMSGCHQRDLAEETCVFQVTVGDDSFGVISGYETSLDLRGEWLAPKIAVPLCVKVHSTHACLGSVGCSQQHGPFRDDLC